MKKHDEIRKALRDSGFKFNDERTALDMTDEEVEKFLVEFTVKMTELGRYTMKAFESLAVSIVHAFEPFRDLNHMLAEGEDD